MPKNRKKGLHYFNLNEQNEQNPALTLGFVIHFYRVGQNQLDLIKKSKGIYECKSSSCITYEISSYSKKSKSA